MKSFFKFIRRFFLFSLIPSLILGFWFGLIIFGFIPVSSDVKGDSMLPTLVDQQHLKLFVFNKFSNFFHKIKRNDLVVFSSDKTKVGNEQADFIKRVVAVEGDEIYFRDGFLFVNGQSVNEPHILKPRSTFGGPFLKDCQVKKVPSGFVFALGDNRKKSMDSRELGFISLNEINQLLPFSSQKKFQNRWRDSSRDQEFSLLPTFNLNDYYSKINEIRKENNLKPLKRNQKLEESAKKRAVKLINGKDDLSLAKSLSLTGYSNIVVGEISVSGYFDIDELTNYFLENEKSKTTILNKDFEETGLSIFLDQIDGCEVQMIVQEFGGYLPPEYEKEDIEGWQTLLSNLKKIQSSWQKLKENGNSFYEKNKTDIDRINEIISMRISNIEPIVQKMENNKWLSKEDMDYTYKDSKLHDEQQSLADKLNKQ